MKATWTIAILATLALGSTGCIITTDDGDSTLLIDNASSYDIYEIYLTEVDNPNWGPNLLGGDILYPDESLEVVDIACDYYDVRVVDELGTACDLLDLDLCFDDSTWVITNTTLAICDGW